MKAKTLQIVWHTKEPVFSIDFHPDGYFATAGGDNDIKIWDVGVGPDGAPQVRFAASLEGHSCKTVNCVRFSHSGHCLASAGDRGEVILWRPASAAAATADKAPPATPAPAAAAAGATASGVSASSSPANNNRAAGAAAGEEAAAEAAAAGTSWLSNGAGVTWRAAARLRGHQDDVNDIAWAHDDAVLLSGGVENECVLFKVESKAFMDRLVGHRHYVQGVSWDPLGYWVVSQSADRSVRIYAPKPPGKGSKGAAASSVLRSSLQLGHDLIHSHTLVKRALPAPPAAPAAAARDDDNNNATAAVFDGQQQQQQQPRVLQASLFHDESLAVFFRRMSWSPDGSLLALAAGVMKDSPDRPPQHTTYIYARGQWSSPLAALPCPSKASTVVAFCPRMFRNRSSSGTAVLTNSPGTTTATPSSDTPAATAAATGGGDGGDADLAATGLPYRLVLAVATLDSVLLYDMQTLQPFLLAGPLHFAPITDLAWSLDGSCLAVSSHDGYCSLLTFQPGELGDVIDEAELPAGLRAALSKVAAAAAATAARMAPAAAAAGAPAAAVAPAAAAAAAASPAAGTSPPLPPQQQQQQKAAVHRIQPQQVGSSSCSPAEAAAAAGGGPRRISPSPVAAASAGMAAPGRMVTPQPVAAATAAAAGPAPLVMDLTATDNAAAAPAAAAAAAAARPVRRVIPQPVAAAAAADGGGGTEAPAHMHHHQQQQQATDKAGLAAHAVPAAAPAANAATKGRVGLAAVQAAKAAVAARKRAAAAAAVAAGGGAADESHTQTVGEAEAAAAAPGSSGNENAVAVKRAKVE